MALTRNSWWLYLPGLEYIQLSQEGIVRQRHLLHLIAGRVSTPSLLAALAIGIFLVPGSAMQAQSAPGQEGGPANADQAQAMTAAVQDLREQVRELRAVVDEMRAEAAQYRAETAALRQELEATQNRLPPPGAAQPAPSAAESTSPPAPAPVLHSLEARIASLEESSQLLSGKIDEQHQTKVESASRYHVRLSGIVLLNLFGNRGSADSADFPTYVPVANPYNSDGDFGATLRQSQIGLEVFGPHLAGARTMGTLQADFAGGFPYQANGVNSGLFRLRIASFRMDWEHTSLVAGQDDLFLSPLSPTSFASLAVPAFSYAGNLWGWTPQLRLEHRFALSDSQSVTVQAGILDNLSGQPPYVSYGRAPQAGERTGPGYGLRSAWSTSRLGQPLTFGVAGYYGRQDWGFYRHLDGWAGMADWQIPIAPGLSLTGELYRGRAAGGLGAGLGRSAIFSGNILDPTTQVLGVNSAGGWSQLKLRANSKLEFNGGFGMDAPFARDLRAYPAPQSYLDPTLAANRGALVNFIYRPRSNLLFSTEFRHLETSDIISPSQQAEQVNMMMGILF